MKAITGEKENVFCFCDVTTSITCFSIDVFHSNISFTLNDSCVVLSSTFKCHRVERKQLRSHSERMCYKDSRSIVCHKL